MSDLFIKASEGLNGHITLSIMTEAFNGTVYLTREEAFQLGVNLMAVTSDKVMGDKGESE